MGRTCAVPKCRSGYKSVKEKYSMFAAPKNIEQFEKWQTAIPRIILKQSQYVCEKHFEQKCILREWVGQDSKGQIIAKKFFGTIRQAAGCNDHTSCPTFLQLYKILSVYSVIKPPKFGNCTVLEQTSPQILVSLQDLKEIYGPKSEGQFAIHRQNIKNKLDEILRQHDLEVDEIIDACYHDYALPETLDCIIYYVTGFLLFN